MPVSADAGLQLPVDERLEQPLCPPTPGRQALPGTTRRATVNLFVAHNRMHDWSYYLGFTERNWNAQDYNFGLTERRQENDPIIGNVQAGATGPPPQRDNANMITLPDGLSSITNMYFWQPIQGAFYAPCVDGDYDMGVIGHEYGHMIENRMIGKGNVRSGHHAGAMGESFGDMNGMEYQNANGFVPTSDENRYAAGTYDTGNKQRAIRNYGMNFPTSGDVPRPGRQLLTNALNFSDMGYDLTGPTPTSGNQVHANGEIWSKIELRDPARCSRTSTTTTSRSTTRISSTRARNGVLPPYDVPGEPALVPALLRRDAARADRPSMLEARDAILSADLMRFGGANQEELWLGYARGGMGVAPRARTTRSRPSTTSSRTMIRPRVRVAPARQCGDQVPRGGQGR